MASMCMDGEPVSIEMGVATVSARDGDRLEAEDPRYHVVDRVDLVDLATAKREQIDRDRNTKLSVRQVDLLLAAGFTARMHMDASISRPRCCVVDRRHRTPERDSAGVQLWIEAECLRLRYWLVPSRDASLSRDTVLRGGVRMVGHAPVSICAVSTFSDLDNFAIGHPTSVSNESSALPDWRRWIRGMLQG